jgi:hypothetical protein
MGRSEEGYCGLSVGEMFRNETVWGFNLGDALQGGSLGLGFLMAGRGA